MLEKKKKEQVKLGVLVIVFGVVAFILSLLGDSSEMMIYICGFICLIGVGIIIFALINHCRGIRKVNNNTSTVNKPEPVIDSSRMKTIRFNDRDKEKVLSFEIGKNNNGIIEPSIGTLMDVFHASNTNNSTPDACIIPAQYAFDNYNACVNKNHFCAIGRLEGEYYIDINDISKVTVNVFIGYDTNSKTLENEDYEKINLKIQTKAGGILDDVDYSVEVDKDIKEAIRLMKKVNNNIDLEYNYLIFMTDPKYNSIKYQMNDSLKIVEYATVYNSVETKLSDSIEYEVDINYQDITKADINNYETGGLCTTIDAKNNSHYSLVFNDNEETTKFYNELKTKIH